MINWLLWIVYGYGPYECPLCGFEYSTYRKKPVCPECGEEFYGK